MLSASFRSVGLAAALLTHTSLAPGQTDLERAWNILQIGANEKSSEKRTKAVQVLGLLPSNLKAVKFAEKALEDAAPEVRVAGAQALGEMQSKASIPKLKNRLQDKEPSVVLAVAHALLLLKDNDAYDVYYEVLTGERKSHKGLVAEQEEVLKDRKKLAEFGFEEGIGYVPFASIGYSAIKALTKNDASPVRAAAAKVLAADRDSRSGRALAEAAKDKNWLVRVAALDAIAQRGDPGLLGDAVRALSDNKVAVRYTAAAAVIRLSAVRARMAKGD